MTEYQFQNIVNFGMRKNGIEKSQEVNLGLDRLSNDELVRFSLALVWKNPRKYCEDKPWFNKIRHLFTEKDGMDVSESVRKQILDVLTLRIRPKK